jgi:ribosomal protein S18 acetylase RimI-like enzyme
VIRLAGTGDIPRIEALMKSVAGFWDESWRPDVLERVLGSPETIALVHEDDTIDGFVCGHDVGFRAYLSELVVSPASQGRGVGSELVAELERRLSDRGCSVLIADVWQDAERFYRSRGWAPPAVLLLRKPLDALAVQPAVADGSDPASDWGRAKSTD